MYRIRPMSPEDRKPILGILGDTKMFTKAEIDVALELVDVYLQEKDQEDYRLFVVEDRTGHVAGYVCFGSTPATQGSFDLYWIAVSPVFQAKGMGTALLQFAEDEIRNQGGRLILIETSSQKKYDPTQQFYARNGYTLESRIKDFYRPGDDRLTYVKRLKNKEE
jgi:ribosomal protein S18 acetylase RimI-like enzyme